MKGIGREPIFSIQTFKTQRNKSKSSSSAKRRTSFKVEKNNQIKKKEKNDENQRLALQINNTKNMNEDRKNSFSFS